MSRESFRSQFLYPTAYKTPIYYFDSAATSLRLKKAIEAVSEFYQTSNSNIHRSTNLLATKATEMFENARRKIARFLSPDQDGQVIFTQNTTDSINQVALSFGRKILSRDDTVLITEFEHHSNILPWIRLCKDTGAKLEYIPYEPNKDNFVHRGLELISKHKPKIFAVSIVSNTLGHVTPYEPLCARVKELGGYVVADCAQAVQHMKPDISSFDFVAFSSHKVFGPFGVGVLWVRDGLMDDCEPQRIGGGTITSADFKGYSLAELPYRFEAGTQPIAEVIGLATAVEWLDENLHEWQQQETVLKEHFLKRFPEHPKLRLLNDSPDIPLFCVYTTDDLTALNFNLASRGFCLRLGHHCAIPIHAKYGISQSLRVSVAGYNTLEELDLFFETLVEIDSKRTSIAIDNLESSDEHDNTKEHTIFEYAEKLANLPDDELVEYLVYLGNKNPKPPQQHLSEDNLVKGCMSKVYVWAISEHPYFDGWSETPTLNGLLQLFKNISSKMPYEKLKEFDFMALLDSTNIFKALTTNRRFGVANLIDRIKMLIT